MKLTKSEKQFLENFLNETGFELWNAGCSHRMSVSCATENIRVSTYDNPLRGKEYKDMNAAVNFMKKQDD